MARYDVTWNGNTTRVTADSEQEAWNAFAAGDGLAYRLPQLSERTIVEVDENEQSGTTELDEA